MLRGKNPFEEYLIENPQRSINEYPKKDIYIPDIPSNYELKASGRDILYSISNKPINSEQKSELIGYFQKYCSIVKSKKIVLAKNYLPEDINTNEGIRNARHNRYAPRFRIIDFKTRFTSPEYVKKTVDKYDDFWDNMELAGYKTAVFLTATFDPSKFQNRIDIVKQSSQSMNRMKTYLKKIHKRELPSIAVSEFTKNGILHFHIIFFGVSYLKNHKDLTHLMQKWGFGKIHYEYALFNRNGFWVSGKKHHKKSKTSNAKSYLKKYLLKSLKNSSFDVTDENDFQSSLFWCTNKRWFSVSRIKYTNQTAVDLIKANRLIQTNSTPKYSYWDTYNSWYDIPDYIFLSMDDT